MKKRKASLLLDIILGIVLILIMYNVIANTSNEDLNQGRTSKCLATTTNYASVISQMLPINNIWSIAQIMEN